MVNHVNKETCYRLMDIHVHVLLTQIQGNLSDTFISALKATGEAVENSGVLETLPALGKRNQEKRFDWGEFFENVGEGIRYSLLIGIDVIKVYAL